MNTITKENVVGLVYKIISYRVVTRIEDKKVYYKFCDKEGEIQSHNENEAAIYLDEFIKELNKNEALNPIKWINKNYNEPEIY